LKGNHDNAEVLAQPWESIADIHELRLDGARIVLCHYPMRSWNGMYKNHLHFYGHEHAKLTDFANTMDVGVDNWNYYPVTLAEIKARMAKLTPWVAKPAVAPEILEAAVSRLSTDMVKLEAAFHRIDG
jgi:calcineurin-like phosphoesterase family protein